MTTARALLRMRASQRGGICLIVTEMNHQLSLDFLNTGRFMTLFYMSIDPQKRYLEWVRAGHEPAIMYARDSFEELNTYALGLKQADDVTLVVIKLEDLPANGEGWQMGSCEAD